MLKTHSEIMFAMRKSELNENPKMQPIQLLFLGCVFLKGQIIWKY